MEKLLYHAIQNEAFHVNIAPREALKPDAYTKYIEKAIAAGIPRIVFSTVCNGSNGSHEDAELSTHDVPLYVELVHGLNEKYEGKTEILCAVEGRFGAMDKDFCMNMKKKYHVDCIILGCRFYEETPKELESEGEDRFLYIKSVENTLLTNAVDVVSAPDFLFRGMEEYGREEIDRIKKIIWAAARNGVYIEKNREIDWNGLGNKNFWDFLLPMAMVIYGLGNINPDILPEEVEKAAAVRKMYLTAENCITANSFGING